MDHFYNKKHQDFSRRLKLLEDRYGVTTRAAQDLDPEDREDLLAALLELRGQLRKLQWYGDVNRRGFIKITKKLDKNIPAAQAQNKYLALKVDPAAFASNTALLESLSKINDWISILTEVTASTRNDDKSSISSGPLKRTISRPSLDVSAEHLAALEQYLRNNKVDQLEAWIHDGKRTSADGNEPTFQHFLKSLLARSISTRRYGAIACLLRHIVFLDDQDDIHRRNCLHRLAVSIGRARSCSDNEAAAQPAFDAESELYSFITPASAPSQSFKRTVYQEDRRAKIVTSDDEPIKLLEYLLDNLQPTQRSGLMARDSAGRTPLHFAAEFGVRIMCEVIITRLQAWKMYNTDNGIDAPSWQDDEGNAPIHLSALNGHPLTTRTLLDSTERQMAKLPNSRLRLRSPRSSAVLALATKSNFIKVVRILVNAGVDLNHQDEQGETALHAAARLGHGDCARLLLLGNHFEKADTEVAEYTYSWTPLFTASVDGQLPIVELLVDAGADVERVDSSGWAAREHAALRGHVDIAERLAELSSGVDQDTDSSTASVSSSPPTSSSINERKSNGIGIGPSVKVTEPVKAFGHRYLTNKSMILVSLGSMDARKNAKAVNLDRIPLINAHSTQLDTALSIVVSAKGAEGEAEVIDLPVQENISTEPIVFYAATPSSTKLLFDLVPTYAGSRDKVVGRGVALLSSITTSLGSKKMPLKGDLTVPVVASGDLDVIGSVTFNFLIITPFNHPNMVVSERQTYWKSMASTMVIGHRGLGKNFGAGRRSLQLGENTIQSFIAAANLGASYVEFDVQLTKDHVPVIYHDFLVSETGIDAPVHTLTLEQFLHVNDVRTPRPSRPASPVQYENPKVATHNNVEGRQRQYRSMSVGNGGDTAEMDEKMKHTRDFKKKGFKGNTRGNHVQAPFATLEEMFQKLPKDVGFNIEMKYPMLFESENEEMDTYAVELNSFVDTVLTKVYELGKGRNIIFSSFHPDICLLLSFKQPSIPVLFLTDAGTSSVGDIRASSLQEAIRFASRWNLLGVVSAAQPLVYAPRLVRVVKESGLVCVSYGTMNNDSEKVALQVKQGIDAVIVDSVLAIRRGLTGGENPKTDVGSGRSLANVLMGSIESLEIPETAESEGVNGNGQLAVPERTKPVPTHINGRAEIGE